MDMKYEIPEMEVRLRLDVKRMVLSNYALTNPAGAVSFIRDLIKDEDREVSIVVNLNNKLQPINYNVVSIGSVNTCFVPLCNVFKPAILSNASSIMFFHCHPSGSAEPSIQDKSLTAELIRTGKMMGIPLVDHIIVGCQTAKIYSFKESTDLLNNQKTAESVAAQ